MKRLILSTTTLLFFATLTLLQINCNNTDNTNPVSPVDHYGHVEGFISINGKPADSVDITIYSAASLSTQSLTKSAASQQVAKDSLGYFRLTLIEGTYDLSFQKNISGRNVRIKKFVTITKGETITINVDLTEVLDTLRIFTIGPKTVSINWTNYATYYQVFRSKDTILWTFIPGAQLSNSGKRLYTASYAPAVDSVPEYGTYYYKVIGYSSTDSLIYQSNAKKFTVENTPPIIKVVTLLDSINFLYGSVQLNPSYPDYTNYSIVVLRNTTSAIQFSIYDTIPPSKINISNAVPYQYIFKDSLCDTGFYSFKFYAVDNTTGKKSDTSNIYSLRYRKTATPPSLTLSDNPQYVQLYIAPTYYPVPPTYTYQILRAVDDTAKATIIDTVQFTGNTYTYLDYKAPADTCFYAVKQLYATTVNCGQSKFIGISHSTIPPAPTLYAPADSGLYIRLQYSTSYSAYPMVIFRASKTDTIALDTFVVTQTSTGIYRDYLTIPGVYSYAAAYLGNSATLGKMSPWVTVVFKNAPVTPNLTITQANGSFTTCRISYINNISGLVITRTETTTGTVQKTDTINASEFGQYELTTTNPQSLFYPDTIKAAGIYTYSVKTFNINRVYSKEVTTGVYIPTQLPSPLPPTVTVSDIYTTISMPSTITATTADTISIYRAKDSLTSFTLLRTLPVQWTNSYIDSVYLSGGGRYYYKIKIIKGGISSEFSAPVEVFYSGLIPTPSNVKVSADSVSVKISIPPYNPPADSLVLYRSVTGSNDLVRIARFDSHLTYGNIVIDSVKQPGAYIYKTKCFYKVISSRFSTEKSINVPGSGYLVFSSPAASDTFTAGTIMQIKYNAQNINAISVSLELYDTTSSVQSIGTITIDKAVNSYSWNIPVKLTPGNGYYIRMIDYYSDELIENSQRFSIKAAP